MCQKKCVREIFFSFKNEHFGVKLNFYEVSQLKDIENEIVMRRRKRMNLLKVFCSQMMHLDG